MLIPTMRTLQLPLLAVISLALGGCLTASDPESIREVTVLYTNDEHGWMEGMEAGQSAANLFALWQAREGFTADGPFLVLSGGDNWTGPAISTWTAGESMVEVMNAMDYDASAVGNHEFDFGLPAFAQRASEADYPYLSSNTRWHENNDVPTDIGILPYTVKTVNDVRFGIIGLTTRDTPTTTNPLNVAELDFIDYEQALRDTVPAVRSEDIDLLLVIAHVCVDELEPLIRATQDLNIAMMGAGHCNELEARRIRETVLLGGGFHFTAYAKASFTYDTANDRLLRSRFATNESAHDEAAPTIARLVNKWSEQTEEILSEPVAWLASPVARRSAELEQAVVNSWLLADSTADVAITNAGGIRIDLPAGEINVGTVVALMPFDNTIIAVNISGAVLRDALENGSRPIVGGLQKRGNDWVLSRSGQALSDTDSYRVLVNSFMYAGGDGYAMLPQADPSGFDTGINYRQPFQDWLQSQGSSASNPLRF